MSTKKSILAVVAAFLSSNVLTTVYYMITDDANMVPYRRESINYAALMANHLVYALLFVHLFVPYSERQPQRMRGFVYGVLIAAVMFVPQALVVRGIWKVDINAIFFANTVAHLLIGGIMGLVSAIIYGKPRASAS